MNPLSAVTVCVVLLLFCCAAAAAPAGLRISGTFVQYNRNTAARDAAEWMADLDLAREAGMTTVVLQWLEHNGRSFMAGPGAGVDATGLILDYADRHGMQVYVGLAADDGWWKQFTSAEYLARSRADCERVAAAAWERYGRHKAFAGWYVPNEAWDAPFAPDQVERLRGFYRAVSDRCKALSGPKPVATAPFFSGMTTPAAVRANYAALLEGAGIDIVMLQDGVGARGWDDDLETHVVPYFAAFRDACLQAGVELWCDLESFRLVQANPARFAPTTADRITRQIAAVAPFVKRIVTFEYFTYMSPRRGAEQRAVYEGYVARHVRKPFVPMVWRSAQVDPGFGYYRDRSARSIAEEIRANGYSTVRFIVTNEEQVNGPLVEALHAEGIGVWYLTFGNGGYSTAACPPGWDAWLMVTRSHLEGKPLNDGYTRFCLNNPAYREWKKKRIAQTLREHPFDGVEIAEPHWPEYPGPTGPAYACFCAHCKAVFRAMFPEESELPDILNAASPRHPDRGPALWSKWLKFRQVTLTRFLDDLVNGPGGIRQTSPGRLACTWTLGLVEPNGHRRVLELHGEDAAVVATVVKPDAHMIQTHWPDWIRGDLAPDYVKDYRQFVEPLNRGFPGLPVIVQADTGSLKPNRRSWDWIHAFEKACRAVGASGSTFYEYFIGLYMYTDPPRITEVRREGEGARLLFTKRLDPATAGDVSRYVADRGKVTAAAVDGSSVTLTLSGVAPGQRVRLTVRGIADARDRRLFDDYPACVLEEQVVQFTR